MCSSSPLLGPYLSKRRVWPTSLALLLVTTVDAARLKHHTFIVCSSWVIRTESHVVAVTDSCIITDQGSHITEFFKLSNTDGYHLVYAAVAAAKSLQLCPTLCDPTDGNPPGSPIPEILQARTLEWVAISFSRAWKRKEKVKSFSRIRLLGTPWTAAYQAPPPTGFSRQEYWSGVPLPSPIWYRLPKAFKTHNSQEFFKFSRAEIPRS